MSIVANISTEIQEQLLEQLQEQLKEQTGAADHSGFLNTLAKSGDLIYMAQLVVIGGGVILFTSTFDCFVASMWNCILLFVFSCAQKHCANGS
jgi:hypothetical protein